MSGDYLIVNGQQISKHEALQLVRMLCNDAKRMAGEFHNMERSAKFRVNWPDEYKFAESEWRHFMEAVRFMYAKRLGDPKTPEADKRKMHLALVIDSMAQQAGENDNSLQLYPGTQQFEGDAFENKKILETFGTKPNLRALLKNSIATRH